jgi:hypothetical protein
VTEETPGPLFAHDEPGPRFVPKDVARVLTRTGLEYPTASARVANYAKFSQIHVRERGKGGAGSPNRFALADVGAAVLLSALQDAGIQDHDVLNRVSMALYGWDTRASNPEGRAHPIPVAVDETINGSATWQLQVDFYRDMRSNERRILVNFFRAAEYDPNDAPPLSDVAKRLQQSGAIIDTEWPPTSPYFWPSASMLIPAFLHLKALTPIVTPSGN